MSAASATEQNRPIELSVEYQQVNTFFADYANNISRGGSFIATTHPLEVGTEFHFLLQVPTLQARLRFYGTVMWVTSKEDASPANPAGMGIEIRHINEHERLEQQALIEGLMRDELGQQLTRCILGR